MKNSTFSRWQSKTIVKWLMLGSLGGLMACSLPPDPAPVSTPSTPVSAPVAVATPPKPSPLEFVAVHVQQATTRLNNCYKHPDLNGYSELVKIPAAEFGTAELYDLYQEKGAKALYKAVDGPAWEKLEPWLGEIPKVKALSRYQYLAVPVEVPNTGPLVTADSTRFVAPLKGIALAPILDANYAASAADYDGDPERSLTAIQVGRKVTFDATSLEDAMLGVSLQREGLNVLSQFVHSKKLDQTTLKGLIVGLQTVRGNELDFVRATDIEFLRASRQYEAKGLEPEQLKKEQLGLAARYLKLRPYFEKHETFPADFDDSKDIPELEGCELAIKAPDHRREYELWRTVTTQMGAVEILAALEAHRLDHKVYPDKLEALLKGYLSRIPKDLYGKDGQFSYKKEKDGYRLESLSTHIEGHKDGRHRW